jgi:hypothetical protein
MAGMTVKKRIMYLQAGPAAARHWLALLAVQS